MTVRDVAGFEVLDVLKPQEAQNLQRLFAALGFFLHTLAVVEDNVEHAGLGLAVEAGHDVFQHCGRLEQADILESTGNSLFHDLVRFFTADTFAVKDHIAAGDLICTGDHVEHSGFTGTVGADQGADLVFLHLQVHAVNSRQTAKLFGYVFQFQDRHSAHPSFCSAA